MKLSQFAPAGLIALVVTIPLALAQLVPMGDATVLVRVPVNPDAVQAYAHAGALLMTVPAPGYAVLHGDAGRIRAQFGLATLWNGFTQCMSSR